MFIALEALGSSRIREADIYNADSVYLKVEVTEKGASDDYRFFYKQSSSDPWTQHGGSAYVLSSSADNARTGLWYKTESAKPGAAFDELNLVGGDGPAWTVATSTIAGTAGNSAGETITLTLTFDDDVNGLTTGSNSTIFTVAGSGVNATWSGTDGSNTRSLTYTVASNQNGQAAIDEAALKAALIAGITDAAGNAFAYSANGGDIPNIDSTALPVVDTQAPTTSIASAALSVNSGTSGNDFITNTAAQTISGNLSANLAAGETVLVSLNNGTDWLAASGSVGSNAWSLASQTLSGSNTLKVKVTDAAGNDGAVFTQAYTITPNQAPVNQLPIAQLPTGLSWTTVGAYSVYSFTQVGTSTFNLASALNVEALVVAGGAAGAWAGNMAGGGGGGGGVAYIPSLNLSSGTYSVTVGAGGSAYGNGDWSYSTSDTRHNGGSSSISGNGISVSVSGGGVGGGNGGDNGSPGGSGGGGHWSVGLGGAAVPGTATNVNGVIFYGNAGGESNKIGWGTNPAGGGGGGASSEGLDASGSLGGHGGQGVSLDITGTTVVYGSGGGGAGPAGGGVGGTNGGNATNGNTPATNGVASTGGGGGGSGSTLNGSGGSGIVVLRALTDIQVGADTPQAITGLQISDPDLTGVYTVTFTQTQGVLTVDQNVPSGLTAAGITGNETASVALTGNLAQINATLAAANGLVLRANAGYTGPAQLTMSTSDSQGATDTDVIAIQVTADVTAPTLSSTAPTTALGAALAGTAGNSAGETITLTLTFDDDVNGLTTGSNSTIFTVAGSGVNATWSGTDGTNTRTLTYTITAGQNGQAAINEAALKAALIAGITDAAGNAFAYTANSGNIPNIDSAALPVVGTTGPTFSAVATAFDENSLTPAIALDIPNTSLAAITLDTANSELVFNASGNTDMWSTRGATPIAYLMSPQVALNASWSIEAQVRINDRSQTQQNAGLTFYADQNGARPAFTYGMTGWDGNWRINIEDFDYGGQRENAGYGFDSAYLKVEVTEKGASDDYRFFYKQNSADAWTQLGGASHVFTSNAANARTGLWYKTGGAKPGAAFDDLKLVGGVPGIVATSTLAGSGGNSAGETITLTLDFDGAVSGLSSGTNNSTIFTVGGSGVSATWSGTGNSRTLTYTIASGQNGQAAINEDALTSALIAGITDAAGNAFAYSGSIPNIDVSALPVIDTIVPVAPSLALGSGVENGATLAEAMADVVMVSAESGASTVVTFTRSGGGTVSKSVTGNGATPVAVTHSSAELTTLGNGSISVSAVATDAAGNASSAGSTSFTLDTVAPTATLTAGTGTNTSNATVQSSEVGTAYLVKTGGASPVTVTSLASITGADGAKWNSVATSTASTATNLSLTGLEDGSYSLYSVDAAGNLSVAASNSYTVDSAGPVLDIQYAASATASSTFGQSPGTLWSIWQILGAPDSTFEDDGKAWAPLEANNPSGEWVEVSFSSPVYADSVVIKEIYQHGFVTRLDLVDVSGNYYKVWEGIDPTPSSGESSVDFKIDFPRTNYLVSKAKVYVNSLHGSSWEQIESIGLVTQAWALSTSTIAGSAGNSEGENITLTLTFDGTVNGLSSGTNSSIFTVGGSGVSATWSGTGSSRTLTYTIAAGQNGQAAINEDALTSALIAGITDAAGNAFAYSGSIPNIDVSPLPVVDTTGPTLTNPVLARYIRIYHNASAAREDILSLTGLRAMVGEVDVAANLLATASTNITAGTDSGTLNTVAFAPAALVDSTVGNAFTGQSGTASGLAYVTTTQSATAVTSNKVFIDVDLGAVYRIDNLLLWGRNNPDTAGQSDNLRVFMGTTAPGSQTYTQLSASTAFVDVGTVAATPGGAGTTIAINSLETSPTLTNSGAQPGNSLLVTTSTLAGSAGNSTGETITLTLDFDGAVSGLSSGTNSTIFTVGGSGVSATWSGTGSSRTLTYTIAAGQSGQAAINEDALKSALIAGITDTAGNAFAYAGNIAGIDDAAINTPIQFGLNTSGGVDGFQSVYLIPGNGFASAVGQEVHSWSFASGNFGGSRNITPLLFDKVGSDYVLRAIGSTQQALGSTVYQDLAFNKVAGNTTIANGNYIFGWKDGTQTVDNEGVISILGGTPGSWTSQYSDGQDITAQNIGSAVAFREVFDGRNYQFNVKTRSLDQVLPVVDTSAPTLSSTAPITTLTTLAGTAGNSAGETITLTLTFDDDVNGLTTGSNSTIFTVAGSGVNATWSGTDGSNTRSLTYTVASNQNGQAAIDEAALKAALIAGITDAAGNAFAYTANSGNIPNIDSAALPVVGTGFDAARDFIAGPTVQSADNIWQYFSADFNNSNISTLQLLSDWDTSLSGVIPRPQWDGNHAFNLYPLVQKQENGDLIIHPDSTSNGGLGKAIVVAWKNTTSSNVTVDLTGSLSLVGAFLSTYGTTLYAPTRSEDGIAYSVTTSSTAYASGTPTILLQGALYEDSGNSSPSSTNLTLSNLTLAPGAMISVAVHRNGTFSWDFTKLDLQITPEPLAGQSVVDLGSLGQLIAPVQVEGKWYYHLDRNGDGTTVGDAYYRDTGTYRLSEIYDLFKQDINGVAGASTNDTYRYATVNGVKLALPTLGTSPNAGLMNGTALNSPSQTNPSYDDLSAIWDAYNGTLVGSYSGQGLNGSNRGSGNITSGAPAAWVNDSYVSATPWPSSTDYAALRVYDGLVFNHANWGMNVALQVL
ncbi:beta strand repeat-containing protein [Limnohabitans sp.]|uniref:beta strand repeat-containing protein n=1 Tax=Limnohabitans sp. TaxID=1907725 RepID=UPI0037BEA94D